MLGRGLASDVNGAYPANDGTVGQIPLDPAGNPLHNHYNTDAIWGGFWNLTQLWSIAYPEYYADWISSQLLVYKDAGWLGDGIACSKYVSGVGTNFTGLAIAAAYNCGIRNFDVALGYEAARKNELGSEGRPAGAGKLDVGQFVERGYSPYSTELHMQTTPRGSGFSASHTLEYSFSAYAVAQMARQLGHEADYERLSKLSEGWKLLFDPETKLMRPRDEQGRFIADFDPYAPWVGFQEDNAVQYTYYVPHDIDRLVEMVGREEFNNRLDSTFLISREISSAAARPSTPSRDCIPTTTTATSRTSIFRACSTFRASRGSRRSGCARSATNSTVRRRFTATATDRTRIRDSWAHGTSWLRWDSST